MSFGWTLGCSSRGLQNGCFVCVSQNALQFFEAYTKEDVTVAELEGSSNSLWTISPPSRQYLSLVLGQDEDFPLTISWTIQRYSLLDATTTTEGGR